MAIITDPNLENHYLGTYIVPEGNIDNDLIALMQAAVGNVNALQVTTSVRTAIAFRPASPLETFSGAIDTSTTGGDTFANARYVLFLGDSADTYNKFGYIRTENTGINGLIPLQIPGSNVQSLSKTRNWATASSSSLGIFCYDDPQNYTFQYVGTLENSPGYIYPTNSVLLAMGMSAGVEFKKAIRPQSTSGSAAIDYTLTPSANYSSNCSNGATTAVTSEMYFRDDNSAAFYPAVGYADNLLVARGSFTIGSPYNIVGINGNNAQIADPILGSDFKYFICVGKVGNHYILMRVCE